jgi:hypothetical protein
MVLPIAAAARAASAAGNAGATVLGLGMGKSDMELTRDLFKLQMRQAKRLWTADWAEASVRHGEQCMQAAQQHAESQAMAMATYYQAEKLASQGIKLARDQDSRAYEMAWRAEVRESLRDELTNQYNRFNIVMLCDTVCLSCVFSLVAEGTLPEETAMWMINLYVLCLGISITLFSISLWCAVIAVRRLHEHTAAILERKLFAQSEDLQRVWRQQLDLNLPTGPNEIYLFNLAYEKWVAEYLHPIGEPSIHMMSFGVVTMFVTAGLVTHNRYLIEYGASNAVYIFWSMVLITSATVMFMKFAEDRKEKKKEGVYDNSWQDEQSTVETGPFAKICRAAKELFSVPAVELASTGRMETMGTNEQKERNLCAETKALHNRVDSLRKESEMRAKTRKDVLQLLTTAAEELDALPEELTSRLNKLLHDIDEADQRIADLVTINTDERDDTLRLQGSGRTGWSRLPSLPTNLRPPMASYPMDAQRLPVSLASLRKKLGESSLTTLLRIKNVSNEPLRLKSGVQLKEGKYVQSLNAADPNNNPVCYHLYPSTEIPPRSEIVVAAKNSGGWIPTSGVEGEIVYSNRDETWLFRIKFSSHLLQKTRKCYVEASRVGGRPDDDGELGPKFWSITKDELDIKANYEVVITTDVLEGARGRKAALNHVHSQTALKNGFLLKNRMFGLGLQWHQRWVILTPTDIVFSETIASENRSKIALIDIVGVQKCTDLVQANAFEIQTRIHGVGPLKFAAATSDEMKDWVQKITQATERRKASYKGITTNISGEDSCSQTSEPSSVIHDGFECIQSDLGTSVLSI